MPNDVVAELPEECKRDFLNARAAEEEWRGTWGGEGREEGDSGLRGDLRISYNSV